MLGVGGITEDGGLDSLLLDGDRAESHEAERGVGIGEEGDPSPESFGVGGDELRHRPDLVRRSLGDGPRTAEVEKHPRRVGSRVSAGNWEAGCPPLSEDVL